MESEIPQVEMNFRDYKDFHALLEFPWSITRRHSKLWPGILPHGIISPGFRATLIARESLGQSCIKFCIFHVKDPISEFWGKSEQVSVLTQDSFCF